jgi:hypothetical protein
MNSPQVPSDIEEVQSLSLVIPNELNLVIPNEVRDLQLLPAAKLQIPGSARDDNGIKFSCVFSQWLLNVAQ